MKKSILNNPWVLAGFMFVISMLIGIIFTMIGIDETILSAFIPIISAAIVAYVFVLKKHHELTKKLAKNTALIYMTAQIIFGIIFVMYSGSGVNYVIVIPLIILFAVIYFLVIYFVLIMVSKMSVKHKKH